MDGLQRELGAIEKALAPRQVAEAFEGFMREKRVPGLSVPLTDRDKTLTGHAESIFATGGKSHYSKQAWAGYQREPKYARYKAAMNAGAKVGTWAGSKSPLAKTLIDKGKEHVETVTILAGVVTLTWGTLREYATAFSHGGREQRWDGVKNPARPIEPRDMREAARQLGKSVHRRLVAEIQHAGGTAGRVLRNLRVEP